MASNNFFSHYEEWKIYIYVPTECCKGFVVYRVDLNSAGERECL